MESELLIRLDEARMDDRDSNICWATVGDWVFKLCWKPGWYDNVTGGRLIYLAEDDFDQVYLKIEIKDDNSLSD